MLQKTFEETLKFGQNGKRAQLYPDKAIKQNTTSPILKNINWNQLYYKH
jgi:hypothetical protein